MAIAYVAVLAIGLTGIASPAALAAPGATITDCASSSGLANAVATGGTWTFACNGTIKVDSALDVTQSVTIVVPSAQAVVIQQGDHGNAVFVVGGAGDLTLTGNGKLTLKGNSAIPNGVGVSPLVYNGFQTSGTVHITGTAVTDTVVGATYAPIYNLSGSMTLTGDTFSANHGDRGGAIFNGSTLIVTGTTFTGDQADYDASGGLVPAASTDAGGAIFNARQGSLTVADSTFTDNAAVGSVNASDQTDTGTGGGIFNFGTATITGTTFAHNQATWASPSRDLESTFTAVGGAIEDIGTSLLLANSTLTANSAYQGGGGLNEANYFSLTPAVATPGHDSVLSPITAAVDNTTFAANTATSGGDNLAFNADGSLPPIMKNDIMYDPTVGAGGRQDCFPSLPAASIDQAGNLEQGDGTCGGGGTVAGWTQGDADLQPLAANPGAYPDATHPLLPETLALGPASLALDLGVPAVCQGTGVGGVDERGIARPAGACDAGAYQSLGLSLSPIASVTIQGGLFDTATVSGTVYSDTYGLANMAVTLSVPAGSGGLSPSATTTSTNGSFSATYTAPASVPASAQPSQPVTVTATTYGQTATATVDVLTPPELTAVAPSTGTAGTQLTLSGLHLANPGATAGYVAFTPAAGGTAVHVTPTTTSDTSATVAVPTGFAAGTKLEVAIQNPAQGLLSNALAFTVTSPGGTGGSGTPPPSTGVPVTQNVPVANTCGTITLPAGSALAANAGSPGTPAGIAPDARVASCVFALTGPTLSQPEPVAIQYNPDALNTLPPARISLFRLRSDGAWTFLPSAVDATTDTVTADVSGPATVVALADTQIFPDVPATYWAAQAIDVAAAAEMVDGFPPPFQGPYDPDGQLTRAQAAKMVVVDAQLLPAPGSTPFTDVRPGDWFAPYIATGYRAGILRGMTATTFGPNEPVTREQFAVMLARALSLKGSATLTFTDVGSIAPWALRAVEAVVAAGYFQGMPGNQFQPQALMTRADAAQVMARVIARQAPAGTS